MIKYFPILLSLSFIASANGLTLKDKERAAHEVDAAVLRSDYSAFKKNLEKAYNIALDERMNMQLVRPDQQTIIYPRVDYRNKKFTKDDATFINNYAKNAEKQLAYYDSNEFKSYQKRRKITVIGGTILLGGLFVKALEKFNANDHLSDFVFLGSFCGGMLGYYVNELALPKYDSLKKKRAGIIVGISGDIKGKADLDLKTAQEAEEEFLITTFQKVQEPMLNKIGGIETTLADLKEKIGLIKSIHQLEELKKKQEEVDALMDGLLEDSATFESQKFQNSLKVAKKRFSMIIQTSPEEPK